MDLGRLRIVGARRVGALVEEVIATLLVVVGPGLLWAVLATPTNPATDPWPVTAASAVWIACLFVLRLVEPAAPATRVPGASAANR